MLELGDLLLWGGECHLAAGQIPGLRSTSYPAGGGGEGALTLGGYGTDPGGGGTHCETDPKSGGSESSDRRAVTALYPEILERWDISIKRGML